MKFFSILSHLILFIYIFTIIIYCKCKYVAFYFFLTSSNNGSFCTVQLFGFFSAAIM